MTRPSVSRRSFLRAGTAMATAASLGASSPPRRKTIAFLGTAEEVARNSLTAPPMHATCAEEVRRQLDPSWELVTTAGFEFVRPGKTDEDRRVRFEPNSIL